MQRWDIYHDGVPYESADGPWVKYANVQQRLADMELLLLGALYQGAHIDTDGYIDTMHLSAWEDIAEYLTDRGVLTRIERGYLRKVKIE